MKPKTGLVQQYHEQEKFTQTQQKIKAKHNIQDDNVIIVEKQNMIKFTVKSVTGLLRFIAKVVLIILAFIGIITVVYPTIRNELMEIVASSLVQIKNYIN